MEENQLLKGTLDGMDEKGCGYMTLVRGVASRLRYKSYTREMIPVLLNKKFIDKLNQRFKRTVRELYRDAKEYNRR